MNLISSLGLKNSNTYAKIAYVKASDEMKTLQFQIDNEFLNHYKNFKKFKEGSYKSYWELCFSSLSNRDFLSYMILCNDLNSTPPVKSFLLYHQKQIKDLTGNDNCKLDSFIRRSIGAFFGMLFQFILGYNPSKTKSIRVSMYDFGLLTASVFIK